jgi:hypothetical protein
MAPARAVLWPLAVAACSFLRWLCPRGGLLVVRRLSGFVPRQALAGSLHQQQAHEPGDRDQQSLGRHAPHDYARGELRSGHHDREHRDDRQPFEYQDQRRRAVCQRVATANAERVEDDQYDGLNGYAAEDVADGHADVARQRCASDDRDFGRVGRQREQDQPAQRRSQMQPRREDVGLLGQLGSCDPDRGGGRDEEHEEDRQRQIGHRALTRDGRAARPLRSARGAGNDGTRAPRWSNREQPAATPGRDVPAAMESARVQLGTPGDAPALWSLMRGHLTCVIATLLALLALTRT